MADLIKKIKIKKQDGTFTDYIPIGADAKNIVTNDGDSVELKLNKKPYYYNSVADMKADIKLKAGDMAITLGYYEPNDGGGAEYKIRNRKDNDIEDNGGTHFIQSTLTADLVIRDERVTICQLGYIPNNDQQDCHDASDKYRTLCNRDNKKYELFFPSGKWYFSETDWYYDTSSTKARYGVELRGVYAYTENKGSMIIPFLNNQRYIWNIGTQYEGSRIVGGNILENFYFDNEDKTFCETALLLTCCCYSHFDKLMFYHCRGSAITVQTGFENYWGRLEFRGVGYVAKDFSYPGLYFKPNPAYNPGSAVSANYIDYINMEGLAASGIYFAPGSSANHNEINDLQIEWTTAIGSSIKHYDTSMEMESISEATQETIPWNDDSDNIEHLYIVKGSGGANYDPLIINNITTSWSSPSVRVFRWTDENEEEKIKYLRRSGMIGELETREANGYGVNVMVNNIHSRGDDGGLPAFHSVQLKTGSSVMISQMNKGLVPFQTKGNFNALKIGKINNNNYINRDLGVAYTNFITAFDERFKYAIGSKILCYDKDSWDDKCKLSLLGSDNTNIVCIKLNGMKNIQMRLKIINYTLDDFPTSVNLNVRVLLKNGTRIEKQIKFLKTELLNGDFQLNEFFLKDISDMFPCDDFIFEILLNKNIMIDGLSVSSSNKTTTALKLTENGSMYQYSENGAIIYCTDRRKTQNDNLGILLVWDGINWKTLDDGIVLNNLIQ